MTEVGVAIVDKLPIAAEFEPKTEGQGKVAIMRALRARAKERVTAKSRVLASWLASWIDMSDMEVRALKIALTDLRQTRAPNQR